MKQLSQLLTLFFIFAFLNSIAQSNIQHDWRIDPLLKKVNDKHPGLKIFSRKNSTDKYVNMAVLEESAKKLKWFTCHGVVFDSVQLLPDEHKLITAGTLDAFDFYRNYCYENLLYIEEAELLYRVTGKTALQDATANNRLVYNYPTVKSAKSTLQKLSAIEGLAKNIILRLRVFDCRTPRTLIRSGYDSRQTQKWFAGIMIRKTDSTEYFNNDPLSGVTKIVLRRQSSDKLFVYNQSGILIDSVPLKPSKYAILLEEKEDVFLLYRGWLELQWQQIADGKRQYLAYLHKLDSGSFRPVTWKQNRQQFLDIVTSLQQRHIAINDKINGLIVPEEKKVELLVARMYKNETTELSYMQGLGFAYSISYIRGQKAYEVVDHRENMMAAVSDKKRAIDENNDGIVDYYNADITNANDFYPFGMLQPGRSYSANYLYRYGYNGKENDNEVKGNGNQQDYGMRIYDPRIARFLSVDPITMTYPELTPYQFASNRPIDGVDLDGLEYAPPKKFDPKTGKMTYDAEAAVQLHTAKEHVPTVVTAVDILLTRGWLSGFILATETASVFEHNKAKTPEGIALQKERANQALKSALFSWTVSKVIGTTIKLAFLNDEVKYLFRGTSESYPGNRALQITESTPTSSDPAVATIFAINSKNYGKGVLQVALPKDLNGVNIGVNNNVLANHEAELVVGLKPADFTQRVSTTITADQSREILKNMGITLPNKITTGDIDALLKSTRKLTPKEIDEYYKQISSLKP